MVADTRADKPTRILIIQFIYLLLKFIGIEFIMIRKNDGDAYAYV